MATRCPHSLVSEAAAWPTVLKEARERGEKHGEDFACKLSIVLVASLPALEVQHKSALAH